MTAASSRRATGELITIPSHASGLLEWRSPKDRTFRRSSSADELARDAAAVRAAGANELHIHPRTPEGLETLDPAAVAHALVAIRAAVPGMPIGLGTGAWIQPGGRLPRIDGGPAVAFLRTASGLLLLEIS
jgi:hypothetical protein